MKKNSHRQEETYGWSLGYALLMVLTQNLFLDGFLYDILDVNLVHLKKTTNIQIIVQVW